MYIHSSSVCGFLESFEEYISQYSSPKIETSVIGSLIFVIKEKQLAFHLLEIGKYKLTENTILDIANYYQSQNIQLINIWEDIWYTKNKQLKSIIKVKLGYCEKIFARKTTIVKLCKPEFDAFINENHLMGTTFSKYKYGLELNGNLVAAASFAHIRKYYHSAGVYNSSELVRYASKLDAIVTGGLSKLISFFFNEKHPDNIMTYADKDWSNGKAYKLLGFVEQEQTPPKKFIVDKQTFLRTPTNEDTAENMVYNTGNIKLYCHFN